MHAAYLLSRAEQCGHLTAQQTNDVRARYLALGHDLREFEPPPAAEKSDGYDGRSGNFGGAANAPAAVPTAAPAADDDGDTDDEIIINNDSDGPSEAAVDDDDDDDDDDFYYDSGGSKRARLCD